MKSKKLLLLWIMPSLCLALAFNGCATRAGTYPTLKQTEINVHWPMVSYQNAAAAGRLTLAEKERINQAYAAYKTAFDQALQAAGGNHNAPTPDNVKALANEVIRTISATPMINHTMY